MPRSHCENENVQFVQELAEVDGPFESPININYRDLTKLELPSLSWNRTETCPQKMKITNTGHTVIISGKWKNERPYLSGGPLLGKYVFSQIHFHWGQDECKGSEHQICGEGFPLEMHVAHFKTDYLSQENALKEKDGMVIVAYLFKLQNEPNIAFKKILSLLPCIQQPCTSQALEPRPILSLLNPFTDDYFLYWGSVITPTCAHILLWMICREPFGISREQVEEFRKIMDSSQHPICKNSRDIQPLHKRNVFHVNASRELDNPMLPIKQMLGCYCKGSMENISLESAKLESLPAHDCSCPVYNRNQEEIEGNPVVMSENLRNGSKDIPKWDPRLSGRSCLRQYVYVQNAIVIPTPILAKKFDSEIIRTVHYTVKKQIKSEDNIRTNLVSPSCCFFPMEKINQIKPRLKKRKNQEKKNSNSSKTFSSILNSLEALKNHTFKKLKEIDSINQEIQGMKSFCQNAEDKRWLRRIEKIMTTQKRFTVKKSKHCLDELKKLARECKFFDTKQSPRRRSYQNFILIKNSKNENTDPILPCPNANAKKPDDEDNLDANPAIKFSLKAQKLIQCFFEDIKDAEDLQKTVRQNLLLKKIESAHNQESGDSNLVSKGYITQKMFTVGNLGDRLFTEVTTEVDTEEEKVKEVIISAEESVDDHEKEKSGKKDKGGHECDVKSYSAIALRGGAELQQLNDFSKASDDFQNHFPVPENQLSNVGNVTDTETTSGDENSMKVCGEKMSTKKNTARKPLENYLKKLSKITKEKFKTTLKTDDTLESMCFSNSNCPSDSTETQKMFLAKFHKGRSKGDLWNRKSPITKISSKKVFRNNFHKSKVKNIKFEGYYLKKKKCSKKAIVSSRDLSSSSRGSTVIVNRSKWKRFIKAQLKLSIEKIQSKSSESDTEYKILSPKRKKLKLDTKKINVLKKEITSPPTSEILLVNTTKSKNFVGEKKATEQTTNESIKISPSVALSNQPSEKYREAVTQTAMSKVELKSTKDQQCDSKIFRTTSAEFKNNLEKSKTERYSQVEGEMPKTQIKKILVKNKSLTSLTNSPKCSPANSPLRLFVENIDSRRKFSNKSFDFKKIGTMWVVESPKKPDFKPQTGSMCIEEKTISGAKQETKETKEKEHLCRTSFKQEEEPPNRIQREKSKIPLVKRYVGPRMGISGRKRKDVNSNEEPVKEKSKNLQKSLTKENPNTNDNQEKLQTSVYLSSSKKNSMNRSYSAGSLNILSKPFKRNNKKRPHSCKRNSRHHIRRNGLALRKASKPFQQTCAPVEEKLKSITFDVARYLTLSMLKNLTTTEKNAQEVQVKEENTDKQKEAEENAKRIVGKPERKIPRPKQEKKPEIAPAEIPKENHSPSKPVHNFIKRNKLMAGKYKRGPSPAERRTEVKPQDLESKITITKREVLRKGQQEKKLHTESTKLETETEKTAKKKKKEVPKSSEKREGKPGCSEVTGVNQDNQRESENKSVPVSRTLVQNTPSSRSFLPAYMMTSYLPTPMEIVENQQRQMIMYHLNTNVETSKHKDNLKYEKNSDFLHKDLEYLKTMKRCSYGGMSARKENSMNYLKTLLSQEYSGTILTDTQGNESLNFYEPLHYSNSHNSGVVFVEMGDLLESSPSNSDLSEFFKVKHVDSLSAQLKNKFYMSKVPQDSGEPGLANPVLNREKWPKDTNYDCEICITLSANPNEPGFGTSPWSDEVSSTIQEGANQSSTYSEKSSSHSMTLKQQRKKRKDNEISADMKKKLLEILEAELKREVGVDYSISTETSSDGHILEDSEVRQRSQSSGSFDNMEVCAQISETMRQYLSSFKKKESPRATDDDD